MVLAVVGMYVFGVVFLIYSKRWQAFGRKISIAAALLVGLGMFFNILFPGRRILGSSLVLFLVSLVGYADVKCRIFPERRRLF